MGFEGHLEAVRSSNVTAVRFKRPAMIYVLCTGAPFWYHRCILNLRNACSDKDDLNDMCR